MPKPRHEPTAPFNVPPEEIGQLDDPLRAVLERVGKENYAQATAREFRPGGRYNPKPRRRFAET